MKPLARRNLAALALLPALLSIGKPARAALMRHTDLTSLCIQSEAVVVADRGAQRNASNGVSVSSFRVTQVYTGTLHAGDSIEVLDPEYSLTPPAGPASVRFEAATVLFLRRPPSGYAIPPGGPYWATVPSGMRAIVNGHVYRFSQQGNPGLYVATPQGHDPDDARGFAVVGTPASRSEFDAQLAAALTRAEAFRAAGRESDPARRRSALLALLPAVDEPARVAPEAFDDSSYRDELARAIIRQLNEAHDLDGVLEAVSRTTVGLDPFTLGFDSGLASALATTATRAAAPTQIRVAAVALLAEVGRGGVDAVRSTFLALLRDPQPAIRAAAALALGADHDHAAQIAPAMQTAWLAEADSDARYALLRGAQLLFAGVTLPRRPDVAEPSCAARRSGSWVLIGCVGSGNAPPTIERATLVATLSSGAARTSRSTTLPTTGGWSSAGVAGWRAPIAFAPSLPPGEYTLQLDARAAMPGAPPVTLAIDLGAWRVVGVAPPAAPTRRAH